jgi:hypothetical protein
MLVAPYQDHVRSLRSARTPVDGTHVMLAVVLHDDGLLASWYRDGCCRFRVHVSSGLTPAITRRAFCALVHR